MFDSYILFSIKYGIRLQLFFLLNELFVNILCTATIIKNKKNKKCLLTFVQRPEQSCLWLVNILLKNKQFKCTYVILLFFRTELG